MGYLELSKQELEKEYGNLVKRFEEIKGMGLNLNMARGKPSKEQLDFSLPMLDTINSKSDFIGEDKMDCRNYGLLNGITECRKLFADILGVDAENVIVGGSSSLNMMFDTISCFMTAPAVEGCKPWYEVKNRKFLCPVPGYDRHFGVTEYFGVEMINVPMMPEGPDMDMVEKLVAEDDAIKGIWCVPKYSNPQGYTYSDETVRRFANLKPAAKDFRIFWDNAYIIHHLYDDRQDHLLNIIEECKKAGNPNMVFEFTSTSKISFPGGGLAVVAASKENIDFIKSQMTYQTIGFDKLNQLRHAKYFKNFESISEHMKHHAAIIRPKFDVVLYMLDKEVEPLGIGKWNKPNGGYFISFDALPGCAKRIVSLAKEAGVVMTGAGATFPYGKDPKDSNIRIAPTFPSVDELRQAMEIFCVCVKLASVEVLLNK